MISKKRKIGRVVKLSGINTISVLVETRRPHPKYKKVIRYSKKYLVHCVNDSVAVGDNVEITECRPISKRKRWRCIS